MNSPFPLNVLLLLLNIYTGGIFFHIGQLVIASIPGPTQIIEYAVWSEKTQCIGRSSTFKAPKRNKH